MQNMLSDKNYSLMFIIVELLELRGDVDPDSPRLGSHHVLHEICIRTATSQEF